MLIGRVGKIYESKSETVTAFSLATTENYKDKSGEWVDKTVWHNCKMFNKVYKFEVGDLVLVQGKISTNEYTNKDGQSVKAQEIIANQLRKLTKKSDSNENDNQGGGERLPF